jgi:penicillin-binding protein 1A
MPTAGKTGTTTDSKDRWFCGFTPYYAAACWTGYDTPEVMNTGGSNPAALIWKRVMTLVHENLPVRDFGTPDSTYIPPVEGLKETTYSVNYELRDGTLLDSKTVDGYVGSEVTETAPVLDGYDMISESPKMLILGENPAKNTITFSYVKLEPSPTPTPTPTPPPPPTVTPPLWYEPTPDVTDENAYNNFFNNP